MSTLAAEAVSPTLARELQELLGRLEAVGAAPVALAGAGEAELAAVDSLGAAGRAVEMLVSLDGGGGAARIGGRDVVTPEEAVGRGVRAVVICGGVEQAREWWGRRRVFRQAGVDVRCLAPIFEACHWDESLLAHEDYRRARERGVVLPYSFVWPAADHGTWGALLDPLIARAPESGDLLEIGAGSGTYTEKIIDRARTLTLVDFSRRLLEEALERRFWRRLDDLRLVHDEKALLTGVADESIDFAFSVDCFVHIKIDVTHRWLLSLARVLRPGAAAMIHFKDWVPAEIDRWEKTERAQAVYRTTHFTHPDMLLQCARRAGLRFEAVPCALSSYYGVFTKPG